MRLLWLCVLGSAVRLRLLSLLLADTVRTTPRGLGERMRYPDTGVRAGKAVGKPGTVCVIEHYSERASERGPGYLHSSLSSSFPIHQKRPAE